MYECQGTEGGSEINVAKPENPILPFTGQPFSVTDHICSANNHDFQMFVYLPNWEWAWILKRPPSCMNTGWGSDWVSGRLMEGLALLLQPSCSFSLSLSNQLNEAGGMDCGSSSDHAVLRCAFNLLPSAIGSIISHPGKTTAMRLWAVHALCPPEMVNCWSTTISVQIQFVSVFVH